MFSNKCWSSVLGFAVLCVALEVSLGDPVPALPAYAPWRGNHIVEIQLFREYLRYKTVHPNIDYEPCVAFLKQLAQSMGLTVKRYTPVNLQNPVVVITWAGSKPNRPAIMLNSHMDVVPVIQESWFHPAFDADVDEQLRIFARGSQDTKSLGMIYLRAIYAAKQRGYQPERNIIVTFCPDEELGGGNGMAGFVASSEFQALNVQYAMDEGGALPYPNVFPIVNDERFPWQMEFVFTGPTGHASILFNNTAGEKLAYVTDKFMKMRREEVEKSIKGTIAGKVTSINLTIIKGGIQGNDVPSELRALFDVRLGVDVNHNAFENKINRWCAEAGGGITINYVLKTPKAPASPADATNRTNPLWTALEQTAAEQNITLVPVISPGATDMRYLRQKKVRGFGFTPIMNTEVRAHGNDEYLGGNEYLAGLALYIEFLIKLCKV